MAAPAAIEAPFEDENIIERIFGLTEMFPEPVRNVVNSSVNNSFSAAKWVFTKTRSISWFVCSTAAILVLPLSIEIERQEYEQQIKNQERNIILGSEPGPSI